MGMHSLALKAGSSALVLREKVIDENGPLYVRLVARRSGVLNWLLTLIGINTTSFFEVYENRIEYSYGSLSGYVKELIPLTSISNMAYGYFRPIILLILSIISLLWGIFSAIAFESGTAFFVAVMVAIIFLLFYFLKKTTMLGVIPHSGEANLVLLKQSVIENENISEEEAKKICDIITALIVKANS